jgi:predicted phosphoadenosine phosphosulfate sulfurtransferase
MSKIYKKKTTAESVYDAAVRRINLLYDRFDTVVVSFSGGKDSTVCLNLTLEVAAQRGRLPLDVYFWDEEAIQPETIDYVERVMRRPDVRLKWLCLPIKHRNACSRTEPYWVTWDPKAEARWVRPMPSWAVREVPGIGVGSAIPDVAHLVYGPENGTVADIRGLRADESLRRYRAVAMKLTDNWIGQPRANYSFPVSPVYDWTTFDVWCAPRLFGWDYNRAYDLMTKAGMGLNDQRVCPPYGEEPLKGLWIYAQCWPDMWHRMIGRVHGAATAGRYAKTELYGYGDMPLPPGMSYRTWTFKQLDMYPAHYRSVISANIKQLMDQHFEKTKRPIHETEPDPLTGFSWRFFAMIANRGDLKARRANAASSKATQRRLKDNIDVDTLMDEDVGTRY